MAFDGKPPTPRFRSFDDELAAAFARIDASVADGNARHGIVRKPGDWIPNGPWEGVQDSVAEANRVRMRGE